MKKKLAPAVQAIQDMRKARNIGYVKLAEMSGVSVSQVYAVMSGASQPTLAVVSRLAKALDLRVVAQ